MAELAYELETSDLMIKNIPGSREGWPCCRGRQCQFALGRARGLAGLVFLLLLFFSVYFKNCYILRIVDTASD